jgi:hypothetical protein
LWVYPPAALPPQQAASALPYFSDILYPSYLSPATKAEYIPSRSSGGRIFILSIVCLLHQEHLKSLLIPNNVSDMQQKSFLTGTKFFEIQSSLL